jgi:putative inorganic carbon (HCO3(-)) transporter
MSLFDYYRLNTGESPTYAHNCFLQLTVETGIIGLTSFLWILFTLFQEALLKINFIYNESKQEAVLVIGLLSGILAFLIHSFFDTNFYSLQLSVYLWFMIGILIMATRLKQEYSS